MNDEYTPDDPDELADDSVEATSGGFSQMHVDTTDDVIRHQLRGMFQSWYLDYASYTILDRAIPHINDGLKPVQRRLLHSMKTLDDGRFNKVANIVGNTMQYHPHGDASIYGALVQLGQKELLVETQGNWGNILTGASAAAGRYIEARLSQFALDTLYDPKVTEWTMSYDGRKKEPVTLPSKFPLLLYQGVGGIAAGLSSLILPHNLNEIIDACIAFLRGEEFTLYPDFVTGGMIDVARYNDGARGGRLKVRAKIEKIDSKTLAITEIPYGMTTESLAESIVRAQEKGKIKVRKVEDITSETALIRVHLQTGASSDKTIDALYAFTDCEVSISPNCCVIRDNKPHFLGVSDVLRHSASRTRDILGRQLEIQRDEVAEQLFFASLERIFIEERIYKDKEFENAGSKQEAIRHIDLRLEPWRASLTRAVTDDDLLRLLEIKMGRILRFRSDEADRQIDAYKAQIDECNRQLGRLTEYTVEWFEALKKKYGDNFPRRTAIRNFDRIEATTVAEANEKLYFNRKEGFAGTALKNDEFICNCSSIDDIIVFYRDGRYRVMKVQEKMFLDKGVIYLNVFKPGDERTTYNVIYRDGKIGPFYMKRFHVTGIKRDSDYNVTKEKPGSYIKYFSANPNGEAEIVKVILKPNPRLKTLQFDVDFSQLMIKGKGALGNLVTKNEVYDIKLKERGNSTLGGLAVWFDPDVLRLNAAGQGDFLGEFEADDQILVVMNNGEFYTTSFDLGNHYEEGILLIEKFDPRKVWSVILFDADQGYYYIKRFKFEPSARKQRFIGENPKSRFVLLSDKPGARFRVTFDKADSAREPLEVTAMEFIGEKSFKARGKRLTVYNVGTIDEIEPAEVEEVSPNQVIVDDDSDGDGETPSSLLEEKSDEELRDEINGQQRIF
ncbi:MAG: DNA gyrase/topoisomerase IV subunit A [Clostridium sp.]|nr:DNA gyrase/topoisomerase IV subunit A [Clostridium sp.]